MDPGRALCAQGPSFDPLQSTWQRTTRSASSSLRTLWLLPTSPLLQHQQMMHVQRSRIRKLRGPATYLLFATCWTSNVICGAMSGKWIPETSEVGSKGKDFTDHASRRTCGPWLWRRLMQSVRRPWNSWLGLSLAILPSTCSQRPLEFFKLSSPYNSCVHFQQKLFYLETAKNQVHRRHGPSHSFFNLMALCHVHWMWPTSVGNWPSRPVTLHHQSLDGYKFMPMPSANAGRNLWMAWDSKLLI